MGQCACQMGMHGQGQVRKLLHDGRQRPEAPGRPQQRHRGRAGQEPGKVAGKCQAAEAGRKPRSGKMFVVSGPE